MGCLWYLIYAYLYIILGRRYYQAKLNDFTLDTWVFRYGLLDADNFTVYSYSIYFILTTLATVGYGDIVAQSQTEMVFIIFWMLFGVGFYSFSIGLLSSILAEIDLRQNSLSKKIAIMNEFCQEMNISKKIKDKMRKTLEYNSLKNAFSWANKTNAFDELPINLRHEVVMNFHDKVISKIQFFSTCQDKYFVVRIVPLLKPLIIKERKTIWKKDSNPDASCFIYI